VLKHVVKYYYMLQNQTNSMYIYIYIHKHTLLPPAEYESPEGK
jgi:hypothetical protein